MSALRSSSMVFTDSRMMLKPVKSTTKPSIQENTKRDLILRSKKLSIDSDSYMKNLQEKYEQKEPKPPPVLGLGVRRYKGSRSELGSKRDPSIDEVQASNTAKSSLEQSLVYLSSECDLQQIQEDDSHALEADLDDKNFDFLKSKENDQADVELKLQEVDTEVQRLLKELAEDDLDLDAPVKEPDSGTDVQHDAAENGDVAALKRLLKNGCDINGINEEGATPIQLACESGHRLSVRIIANNGEKILLKHYRSHFISWVINQA